MVVALLELQLQISYTLENVVEGKTAAKEALQQKLGLKRADLPLVGIITRLTHQKGIHLIKHAIWRTLERNGQVFFLKSVLKFFRSLPLPPFFCLGYGGLWGMYLSFWLVEKLLYALHLAFLMEFILESLF